jgi:hypothetical protein
VVGGCVGGSDGEEAVGLGLAPVPVVGVGVRGVAVGDAGGGCRVGVTEWVRVGMTAGSVAVGGGAVGSLVHPAPSRIRRISKRREITLAMLMVHLFPLHCVEKTPSWAGRSAQDSQDRFTDA